MFTQQIDSMDMSLSKLQEKETLEKEMASEGQGSLACCGPWSHRVRHNLATEQQILFLVPGPRSLFREAVLDAVSTWTHLYSLSSCSI